MVKLVVVRVVMMMGIEVAGGRGGEIVGGGAEASQPSLAS